MSPPRAPWKALRVAAPLALSALALGCDLELEHGLDERQANEVVSALGRSGIDAEKAPDDAPARFKIRVSRSEAAQALLVLESHALPRRGAKGLGEEFAEKGLLPSATAERARLAASLAADLERTLETLPQVTAARVHLALPDEDPLRMGSEHRRPTAAVLLRGHLPLPTPEAEIRRLVAGAVQGLQPADVGVVASADPVSSAVPELDRLGPFRVAHAARSGLLGLLLVGAAALIALGGLSIVLALRLSALRARLRSRE